MYKFKNLLFIVLVLFSFGLTYSTATATSHAQANKYSQDRQIVKKSIAETLLKTITGKGIETAIKQYFNLKKKYPESYNFDQKKMFVLDLKRIRFYNTTLTMNE